jgi:hypothetical protein
MEIHQELIAVSKDKDNIQKPIMQKENDLMLGYANHHDLLSTIFGLKLMAVNGIVALAAVITTFITSYIWDDANAIYMLLLLIGVDAVTGIFKAIKAKTFSSAKLPRILVIMVTYTTMLGIAWNISKFSPFYNFLPAVLYGGFVSTLIVSIFENLHQLNWIPDNLYNLIKGKLDLLQQFVFGKNFNKKKK